MREADMNKIEVLGDGDVQLVVRLEDGRAHSRRFRMHFGHVVEVCDDKVRRVGADLSYRGPALIVRSSLAETVRRASSTPAAGPATATATAGATQPAAIAAPLNSAHGRLPALQL
jgi:hypothetical protein